MNQDDLNKSVVAHLFLAGKPLVLNYQLMEKRLARPRLTTAQRTEYQRQLNYEGGFLTVADRDDAEPLLIHFRSENDRYTLRVATPGRFYGYFLSMERMQSTNGLTSSSGNLIVTQDVNPTRFYMNALSKGYERLFNVARKLIVGESDSRADAQDKVLGPTFLYRNKTPLVNDEQQYFSDTVLRAEHVIWDPLPVEFTVQIRGAGVLALDDIG
ncbi:hypothetical protein SAMN04490202_5274 [Pseudomonas reinekei]|jgi:hypothetical protein|uniref:Uncharacterized protein n=1 Tax=Pseudomonas reinekei TaxID=395598 RepID=A0A1H0UBG8_PSERE|nr:hypothetical protein [Pseudomonas reinekei]KAB0487912.1 hypothetical protein F7R15_03490 [Pseudomonas reinekei]OLU05348.1 hypothetical protein BVK86_03485 [Pseudomonas reinekei]SDP63587.1 hypothetical protein SAMN04490202_5274 [Pseudomonas reinekei]